MREIALHLLDIAENSVSALARNICLYVCEDLSADRLRASVSDDGKGMDAETAQRCLDPFVTSRTTRKVGLGLPLFKEAAEACYGYLQIQSTPGRGTRVEVEFQHSHIDRMPLGDLASTLLTLVIAYPQIHWTLRYQAILPDGERHYEFDFDDQPIKEELAGISLSEPAVLAYLRETLETGIGGIQKEVNNAKGRHPSLRSG